MKKMSVLAVIAAMSMGLSACGGSTGATATTAAAAATETKGEAAASGDTVTIDQDYTWNVAMNVSESTLNYKFYDAFKKEIEEKSGGKITMNLFPNGQLGGDAEQLQSPM